MLGSHYRIDRRKPCGRPGKRFRISLYEKEGVQATLITDATASGVAPAGGVIATGFITKTTDEEAGTGTGDWEGRYCWNGLSGTDRTIVFHSSSGMGLSSVTVTSGSSRRSAPVRRRPIRGGLTRAP